ncbi:DUF3515 domain-containing protein [Streptomyces sp. NPDC096013]|uniref:DUF3515 domain-containing protein n=1 Tax=Streptomyces sp. NPDC096013 TaxID=3366069 RepID=UPI00382AF2A3
MIFRRETLLASLIAATSLFTMSACDHSPSVAVPTPDSKAAGYCAKLHQKLPAKLDGISRRDPKPSSKMTAEWGKLVVLRCGVDRPAEDLDGNADGGDIGGVSWSYASLSDGSSRMTTTLRKVYVEVTLRGKYARDAGVLTDLAPAIKHTIPVGIA